MRIIMFIHKFRVNMHRLLRIIEKSSDTKTVQSKYIFDKIKTIKNVLLFNIICVINIIKLIAAVTKTQISNYVMFFTQIVRCANVVVSCPNIV